MVATASSVTQRRSLVGRPRSDDVPTVWDDCPKHGRTEFRIHRSGVRRGKVKYKKRCPECHAENNRRL